MDLTSGHFDQPRGGHDICRRVHSVRGPNWAPIAQFGHNPAHKIVAFGCGHGFEQVMRVVVVVGVVVVVFVVIVRHQIVVIGSGGGGGVVVC